jgi:hypothetical protein
MEGVGEAGTTRSRSSSYRRRTWFQRPRGRSTHPVRTPRVRREAPRSHRAWAARRRQSAHRPMLQDRRRHSGGRPRDRGRCPPPARRPAGRWLHRCRGRSAGRRRTAGVLDRRAPQARRARCGRWVVGDPLGGEGIGAACGLEQRGRGAGSGVAREEESADGAGERRSDPEGEQERDGHDHRPLTEDREQATRLLARALHQLGECVHHKVLVECEHVCEELHVVLAERHPAAGDAAQRPHELEVALERRFDRVAACSQAGRRAACGDDPRREVDLERRARSDEVVEVELVEIGEQLREQLARRARAPFELPQLTSREAAAGLTGELA